MTIITQPFTIGIVISFYKKYWFNFFPTSLCNIFKNDTNTSPSFQYSAANTVKYWDILKKERPS